VSTDLFGKPVVSAITGEQGVFPFPLPSPLDREVQREAVRWRESRCPETAEMFADESRENKPSIQEPKP
jgi:hypothetical protein